MGKKEEIDEPKDIRVKTTSTIWGTAVGMLGISIPLSAITESPVIAILVIVGATVSTVAVWTGFGFKNTGALRTPQLQELEQRIANLETIVSFEDQTLRTKIEQLRSRAE